MPIHNDAFTQRIMDHFTELCKIYRKSGHEKEIADYLLSFAEKLPKELGISVHRQYEPAKEPGGKSVYNLVIKKPGKGKYVERPPVALQAHIDMVCQPMDADFSKGVEAYLADDDERMLGRSAADHKTATTLGADDGIGVACIMAILEDGNLKHPPIEAILTSDEEDGMSGAAALDWNLITAKRLINIDTEEERKFFYGCAGGIYTHTEVPLETSGIPEDVTWLSITISGLTGGHSGIMIDKHQANANRLMGRLLNLLRYMLAADGHELSLVWTKGGNAHNVITLEAEALITVPKEAAQKVHTYVEIVKDGFAADYPIDTGLKISVNTPNHIPQPVMNKETLNRVITLMCNIPNGVIAMHPTVPNLVETSSNMGIVKCDDGKFYISSFVRSSVGKQKDAVAAQIEAIAKNVGASFRKDNDFPEWNPNPDSLLKKLFEKTYLDVFNIPASTESIHAGLECGYFAKVRPDMDIIAIGPTITGAHTDKETLYVSTVAKVAELLLAVLERLDGSEQENTSVQLCAAHRTHTHVGHVCAR